jgi:hypothetical protein
MKLALILFAVTAELAAIAAGPPLLDFCEPYNGSTTEVVWKAPSNGVPTTARIFHVVPTRYSPETISNLLWLGGLAEKNKIRPTQDGVFAGKGVLTYGDEERTRHLDIIPSEGTVALTRVGVIVAPTKEAVKGVPGTNEAVHAAFDLLPMLGISKSEVATNIPGKPIPYTFLDQTAFHKNKATGKVESNVVSRGVSLCRQIDGIPVWGDAGVFALFGNEGKIANVTATWRSIQPRGVCQIPTAAEFVARIKSGASLIRKNQIRAPFKKLTIDRVELFYWESDGSEHQSSIYPFAVLEAATDQQGENAQVQLFVLLTGT